MLKNIFDPVRDLSNVSVGFCTADVGTWLPSDEGLKIELNVLGPTPEGIAARPWGTLVGRRMGEATITYHHEGHARGITLTDTLPH